MAKTKATTPPATVSYSYGGKSWFINVTNGHGRRARTLCGVFMAEPQLCEPVTLMELLAAVLEDEINTGGLVVGLPEESEDE